ncbi:MAG: Lrp/AsnC family transcriptional regulator [Alphaproteobacteria bacterium]|nr:MAG: Lrp/AsnC family transcriptional regulator [Alphaproteobacteria bacterium]
MKARGLDAIDLKILAVLQTQGRITNRQLATSVGLSPSPCLERVRRLEQAGYIRGYRALIDLDKLYAPVTVMAQITLAAHGKGRQAAVEPQLTCEPTLVELLEVSGDCDYVARFVVPSIAFYQRLTAQWLAAPALGIERIVSHVVMRQVKEAAALPLAPAEDSSGP